jgi:PAS domain S-box-containing protein
MNRKPARIISLTAAVITMLIGVLILTGGATRNDFLRLIITDQVKMKVNVALGFIFSSIVILLCLFTRESKLRRIVSGILSITVFLIGFLTLLEYIFHHNLGIDKFLFHDELKTAATYFAGRMSLIAAVNFTLIGIGLFFFNKEKAVGFQFFYLVTIALFALLTLISFNLISDVPVFIQLPVPVAIGFILLSVAVYLAQPVIREKINFQIKLVTGFIAAIILLVLISVISSDYNQQRINNAYWVDHANKVLDEAAQTLSLIKDVESGSRIFVITQDSNYLSYYIIAKHIIPHHIQTLKGLAADDPSQQQRIDSLLKLSGERIYISEEAIRLSREKGLTEAVKWIKFSNGKYYTDRIRYYTQEIQNRETDLLVQRELNNIKSIRSFNQAFYTLLVTIAILLLFIFFIINDNLKKRIRAERQSKRAEEEIRKLNTSLEQRVIERTVELQQSETKYRYLFDNNPIPMWIIDLETFRFLNVNEAAIIHYGYNREEFLSMTALDIRPESEKQQFIGLDRSTKESARYKGIWKHLKKDGTLIDAEIITHDIFYEGRPARFILSNDVTDRKKAEDALTHEKRLLRTLIDILPDYIYFKDTQSRHLINNKANVELIGATNEEETIGKSVVDFFGEELAKSFIEDDQRIIKTGESISNREEKVVLHTGEVKYLLTTKVPVKGKDDKVTGLVGISRDITNQKEVELELRNNKYFLEKAQKVGQIGHWISDLVKGKFTCSEEACNIFGVRYSDFDNKNETFLKHIHPEDKEKVKLTTSFAIENNKPYSIDYRIKVGNSTVKWVNEQAETITDETGRTIQLMGIVQDITERKLVEEKIKQSQRIYKTIASHIPGSLICLLDPDYRYILVEGDMVEKLGFSKETLLDKKVADVLPPERYALTLPDLVRVFKGYTFITDTIDKGYDLVTRYVPLKDESGKVYMAMTVSIDVTELKNAQRKFLDLNIELERKVIERTAQLEEVNKELEAFSYSVSHDLRAPLRIIDGFAGILVSDFGDKLNDEGNRTLEVIMKNAQRMGQLIDDLLNLSRLGRQDIRFNKINMESMVKSVVEEVSQLNNQQFKINYHQILPSNCDNALIRQVWVNLISNAVKYSGKQKHPEITIGSYQKDGYITYFVKDNGVGFDMKYAGKLFGVFQRLHKITEFEGTGVGLALVHRIIAKHGGKVWAHSEPDKGATFYFSLPAA